MTTRPSPHSLARVAALGLAVLSVVAPRPASADVSFVAAGTGVGNSGTNVSISPGIPAGNAQNDVLVMVVHTSANSALATPTGWTLMGTQTGATGSGRTTVWWLRRGATAPTAPTVRITSTTTSTAIAARIWAFRGVVTAGNPYDVLGTAYRAETAGTTFTGDDLTTTVPYATILFAGGSTAANTWGPAGGTTNGGMLPSTADTSFYYANNSTTRNSLFLAYDGTPTATAGAQGAPTMAQSASTAGYSYTFTLEPAQVTLGDGTNPTPAATVAPGAGAQAVDAFTLATNGTTDAVNSVTVTLAAGSSAGIETIGIYPTVGAGNVCTGTALGTVGTAASPLATDTPTIALTGLTATTTATTYYVCVKPRSHAAMPVPPGSNYPVTGTVTAFVPATFQAVGSDASSGTVNLDNQSPTPAPSGLGGASGDGQVALTWTGEPTDADFLTGGEVVVVRGTGAAPTGKPVEGSDYTGGEPLAGGAVVACVAAPGAKTCTATGLTSGTGYYFIAYARDSRLNYSVASNTAGPVTPAIPQTIQLVTGANVIGQTVCPGDTGVYADQFGFTVAGANDRVYALTVSGLGATTPIASVSVADDTGAVIASATPTGDAQAFTFTAPNLAAPAGTTYYRVYFDVKGHSALADGNIIVTPTVTSYGSTNTPITGSGDSANSFTINNTPQANVPSASAGGATETSLTVTYGASTGAAGYVVFARRGGTPTGPADGTTYTSGSPDLANTWIAYAGPSTAPPAITGLASSSTYNFAVYARDACGNYSKTAALATGTTSAPAQAIAVGNGTGVAAASVAPGATTWTPVDSFSVQITSGAASNTLQSVTYTSLAGMSQYLAGVRLVRASDSAVLSTVTAPSGDVWTFTGLSETLSTTAAQYRLELQPKGHAAMPPVPGANLVLAPGGAGAGVVTAIGLASGATITYSDGNAPDPASGQVLVDNLSPADPTAVAATGGPGDAHLSWTNPPDADLQRIVVLAKAGSPFLAAERPAEGDDPALNAAYGAATVRYRGTTSPQAITGLTGGTWYFKLFARDTSGNFSSGVETSAVVPSFIAEGDPTPGSVKPVVSIVNPMRGGVVGVPFRLQARLFSPRTSGGVAQPITGVTLLVDDVDSRLTMSPLAGYGTTTESGVWGATVSTLTAGSHTLRVAATNAAGTVYSETVTVTVLAGSAGDGNLVVRDNASQLCSDCHAMATHSSESTGNKWGSWAVTCRECHTPHDTTNIELVRTKIKPPELAGTTTEKDVVFLNKTGYAAGSFASSTNNGPCQVCHTQTIYYQASGASPGGTHETGDCATCHLHNKGLAASCTMCHGTEGRPSIAGADARQSAAPPAVAAGSTSVTGGGAHLAHVNKIPSWRTNPLPCAACHPAPHATKGQTDIQWSALATGNGAIADASMNPLAGTLTTTWTATPSCTNWCHGGGMPAGGGSHTSPAWTEDATAAQCGTCHASPPPVGGGTGRDHPQNTACSACHGTGYAQASLDPTAKATHLNGTIEKPNNGCTACHGKLAGPAPAVAVGPTSPQAAPGYDDLAVDTQGNTRLTAPLPVGVGAHGKHVNDGMMSAKSCNVCHPLPLDGDTSHANGSVAMAWSAPATSGSVTPGYTRPTCTNYCHSSGDPMGAAAATTTPVSWTAGTSMTCSSCHPSSAIATNAHAKHVSKYLCSECHVGTTIDGTTIVAGGGTHVNGSNDVSFDASSAFVQGGSYTLPSSPVDPATCSGIYCHSNGTKRAPPYTSGPSIAWNGGNTTCTSCHQNGTALATLSHPAHVNHDGAAAFGANYGCQTCHSGTTSDGATIASAALHVNRAADVDAAHGYVAASGSCATYCHSSGQGGAATPQTYSDMAWGTPLANDCKQCHGRYGPGDFASQFGEPNYASGAAGSATANSHRVHVSAAADCYTCHTSTVTSAGNAIVQGATTHTDGQRQVTFNGADAGASAAYDLANKRCSSVACHGNNPVQWGAVVSCGDCHLTAAGPAEVDVDSWNITDKVVSKIKRDDWTANGHGVVAAIAGSTDGGCAYCHTKSVNHKVGTNPFRLRAVDDAVCNACHATGSAGVNPGAGYTTVNSSVKVNSWHAGAKHGANTSGQRCWDCHDPHGDGNAKMIGKDVNRAPTDAYGLGGTRVTVNFTLSATPVGQDYASNTDATKVCNACHTATLHYKSTAPLGDSHMASTDCTKCHAHEQGANGNAFLYKDPATCNLCHDGPTDTGTLAGSHASHYAVSTATTYANTTDNSTTAAYGFACAKCHPTAAANHMNDSTHQGTAASRLVAEVNAALGFTAGGTITSDVGPSTLEFQSSTGSCAAASCHSNASPLSGTALNQTVAWGDTTWVKTGATANQCVKCHQMSADSTGAASSTKLSHGHYTHLTTYGFGCAQCHSGIATGDTSYPTTAASIVDKTRHVNGQKDVAIDTTYNPGSPGWAGAPGYQCSNTYCHSNGTSPTAPPASTSIAWNTSSSCTSCHGGPSGSTPVIGTAGASPAGGSATHVRHVDNASLIGTNLFCGDCHKTVVSAGTNATFAAGGVALHVNRTKNVSIADRGTNPVRTSADTTATCSATYCHSAGNMAVTPSPYVSATWSTPWTGPVCAGCHGTSTGTGSPDYPSGTAGGATANSHPAHTQDGATSCRTCHNGTATAAGGAIVAANPQLHLNGSPDVVFFTGAGGLPGTPSYSGASGTPAKQCSSVACHGNNPVQWGAVIGCRSCHGAATGLANDDDVNDYTFTSITSPGTISKIDLDDWTTNGHGATSLATESNNTAPDFDAGGTVDGCVYCHDKVASGHGNANNFFRLANVVNDGTREGKIRVCTVCHGVGSTGYTPSGAPLKTAGKKIDATHYGAKHTAVNGNPGGQLCWDCHDPHGDRSSGTNVLAYMIQKLPVVSHTTTFGATDWGIPTTTAATPDFRRNRDGTDTFGWGDYVVQTTNNGVCQVCHLPKAPSAELVAHFRTNLYDASHNPGQRCTGCHKHEQGTTDAFKGAESRGNELCGKCHTFGMIAGGANAEPDRPNTYHHVMEQDITTSGTPALTDYPATAAPAVGGTADKTCVQCHADHNVFRPDINTAAGVTRGNNLRVSITANGLPRVDTSVEGSTLGAAAQAPGTTFTNVDAPVSTTTSAGICITCHTSTQAKDNTGATPNQKSDGTTATYAIDATAYAASSHDYTVGGTFTKDGSAVQNNCVKCHNTEATSYQNGTYRFSLHSSPDRRLRGALGQAAQQDDHSEDFCYRCHSTTANAAAIGGTTKPAANNDWYGAVTTMSAASQDVYNQMQKGTAGSPSSTTTVTTGTLSLKPAAEELPGSQSTFTLPTDHLSTTDNFAGGTWVARSMSPNAATVAYETYPGTTVAAATSVQYWRRVSFISPPVAAAKTLTAGTWSFNVYGYTNNTTANARVRYAIYTIDTTGALKTSLVTRTTQATPTNFGATLPGTSIAVTTASVPAAALAVNDRIVLDLEVQTQFAGTGNRRVDLSFGTGAVSSLTMGTNTVAFADTTPGTSATGRHDVGVYTGLHRPSPTDETGTYLGANRHVECEDCHSPHAAKPGLHTFGSNAAGAVLTGAPIVTPAYAANTNWQNATAVTYTTGTVGASTPEAYVCLRCHSSYNTAIPNDPAGTPTSPWDVGGGGFTNQALEFSTSNQSYHPVLGALPATDPSTTYGSSRLDPLQLVGSDHTWTPGQTMTCTDCHNADAASPAAQGPHGSAIRYMLAGTNKAWPYTVAGATSGTFFRVATADTGAGSVNGLFCLNCHPSPQTGTNTNNFHQNADVRGGQHGSNAIMNCIRCHIRVPHGGKVSRLILTLNAPARYQVTGQAPNFDSFQKSTTGKNGYSSIQNYFNSTCSQHNTTITNAEAW